MVFLGIIWVFDALAARKAYATEFYSSLKKGYIDLTSPIIDFTTDQVLFIAYAPKLKQFTDIYYVDRTDEVDTTLWRVAPS